MILSADVSAFQDAFVRAANTTKQQVTQINQTLSSTGKAAETAAKTWREFVGERMGQYMKQFGSHGAAIRQIAAEWAIYKQSVQDAGKAGKGVGDTAASVTKVSAALSSLKNIDLPSAARLVQGLNSAEVALKKLGTGKATVSDLDAAIFHLSRSKEGLGNTAAIDKLITRMSALRVEAEKSKSVGFTINPNIDISGTLTDIEKIKGVLAGKRFNFTLTADTKALQTAMVQSTESTRAAVSNINAALKEAGFGFGALTEKAKLSVSEYVRALGQLNNVPTTLKTTVQAPNVEPVIQAIQKVKSNIAAATVTAMPRLTLSADTRQFNQSLLQTKALTNETWAEIRQTFTGVDKAIADAAAKSRVSVQQLVSNFNALKGAGPDAIVMQVKPPDFTPVVQAARLARQNVAQTFLTPLPAMPVASAAGAMRKEFASTTAVGQQFNQLLREMPNFAIDARIGVMSLSNNLPYFVDAIQNARKQGQGFGGILKTMGSSMFSVSGIAILAVTAFTAFAGSFSKTKDKAATLRDELNKAKEAAENFVEGLELITKTRLKGEMSAQKELVALKILYEASQNQNLSLKERKLAVDELQRQYPAYFKNLSDEAILAGSAKAAYDDLTAAILRKAKAASAEKELETLSSDERRIRKERQLAAQSFFDATQTFNRAKAAYLKASKEEDPQVITYMTQMQRAERNLNEAKERALGLGIKLTGNMADQAKLAKEIAGYGTDAFVDPGRNLPEVKGPKKKFEFLDEWLDFNPNSANLKPEDKAKLIDVINRYSDQFGQILKGANFRQVQGGNDQMIEAARKWWEDFQNGFVELAPRQIDVDFSQIPVVPDDLEKPGEIDMPINLTFTPEQIQDMEVQDKINGIVNNWRDIFKEANIKFPKVDTSKIVDLKQLDDTYRAIKGFVENVNDILKGTLSDSFSALGDVIGDALAGNDIKSGVQAIVGVLGDAITAMGKALIEYGIVKSGLDKILAGGIAVPGGAAIVAGVAAIAAGQLVKSSFKPFADGGIVYGPTLGLVGEYAGASSNPEVIAPLSKLKDMLSGAGGDKFPIYLPMHSISGSTLRLWYARADKQGRKFN